MLETLPLNSLQWPILHQLKIPNYFWVLAVNCMENLNCSKQPSRALQSERQMIKQEGRDQGGFSLLFLLFVCTFHDNLTGWKKLFVRCNRSNQTISGYLPLYIFRYTKMGFAGNTEPQYILPTGNCQKRLLCILKLINQCMIQCFFKL